VCELAPPAAAELDILRELGGGGTAGGG
jgi:hypothetical protein